MQDSENGMHWMVWVLVVAVSMAAGALAVKWALGPRPAPAEQAAAPAPVAAAESAPVPAPVSAPAADNSHFDLPGDEQEGDSSVVWGKTGGASKEASAPASAAAPADPAAAKESRQLGLVKNALSAAAEKLLDNPKALAALFNNEYVVRGFMSRDTVRQATANKASLAAYLKNPANLSAFMAKPVVQRGLKSQQLTGVMASTKLVGALLDSPGGKALLSDPKLLNEVVRDNPSLLTVLSNPAIMSAMAQNPKTAGVLGQVGR